MDSNDEILLNAARAAVAKLPALEADKEELSLKLNQLIAKINQYKNIAAAVDQTHLNKDKEISTQTLNQNASPRSKRGGCMADIKEIIGSKPLTATEIHKAISQQLNVTYGFSTVHSSLQRGELEGVFKHDENGRWSKV